MAVLIRKNNKFRTNVFTPILKTNYLKYKELCRLAMPIITFTHMYRIGFLPF